MFKPHEINSTNIEKPLLEKIRNIPDRITDIKELDKPLWKYIEILDDVKIEKNDMIEEGIRYTTADVNNETKNKTNEANESKETSETREPIENKKEGLRREEEVREELEEKYPPEEGYEILSEVYLRDKDGKIVRDPVTGEARRIDFVVVKDGKVVDSVEVTSKTADKTEQSAKESRIRDAGGNYIKDENGHLIEIPSDVQTRIERRD